MKGSTGTKVLAFVTAVLLAAVVIVPGVGTLKAKAVGSPYLAQRDSASLETTTLKKILKIENGSNIPAATFTITVFSFTELTEPWIPPIVTTLSPFWSEFLI